MGIDALPGKGNGVELVLDSVLDATFIYPTEGDKVVQLAMDILEKKPFERETKLKTAVVDAVNAHVMELQTNHIGELDGKIETLNDRVGIYLSRVATQRIVLYGGLIILLLIVGLLIVVYKSLRSKNRLNRELSRQKEQLEEQRDQLIELSHQLEEATHAKLVFFTNISHDFRTPLTLVADPVEQLLADPSLEGDRRRMLLLVQRNVQILLRLVNQILDFRRYETGKMEFTPVPLDLLQCFVEWNDSFRRLPGGNISTSLSTVCPIRIITHRQMRRSWNAFTSICWQMPLNSLRRMERSLSVLRLCRRTARLSSVSRWPIPAA